MRTHLAEAFHLHQLNHDEIPDTPEELRTRNARIVQLCEWAEDLLEDRTEALAEAIARARRAPEIIAGVRADAARLRARIPHARDTVDAHGRTLLPRRAQAGRVESGRGRAAPRVRRAQRIGVAERRREAGQREQANLALEAATEAARRAATLIDAVETFEVEALRAESTLSAIVEDSRDDLIVARNAPQVPAVTAAMAELEAALRVASRRRRQHGPVLAAQPAPRGERRAGCRHRGGPRARGTSDPADSSTFATRSTTPTGSSRSSRDVIAGHRGWIGADARTRVAEAERIRIDLDRYLGTSAAAATSIDEDQREQALAMARRVAFLASEGLQLAQRDIDASRPQGGPGQWGPPNQGWGGGRRGGMSDGMGGILGGLVIGSLLGDIFDG